mmetsp:Transcript_21176/g.30263  ORF Transcript_21176/g.30263 Transcript_21176/m.30263 type:complete len:89 (+) Transcript_21176:1696-1962(+)
MTLCIFFWILVRHGLVLVALQRHPVFSFWELYGWMLIVWLLLHEGFVSDPVAVVHFGTAAVLLGRFLLLCDSNSKKMGQKKASSQKRT